MDQQNNPSVPESVPANGQPQPVIRAIDEPAQHVSGEPAAGWGAPQQPAQHVSGEPAAGWGAPQPYATGVQTRPSFFSNWTLKKGLIVGGVAVVVAAAAGAGAYAAAGTSSTADSSSAQGFGPGAGQNGQGGFGGPGGGANAGPGGLGMGMGGLNAAIHSEYVILQNGSYATMAGQLGSVTDISSSSLTVKSEDGFSRTYSLGSGVVVQEGMRQRGSGAGSTALSLSDVKPGSSVRVTALKEGEKYTAQTIQIATATTSSSTQGPGTTN